SFKRNFTIKSITESTSNSSDDNNTFTKLNAQEHRISAISAEKIIDNRIKFLKNNIYNRVNYELLEGKKWQEIINMDDKDLEKLGITDHLTRSILGSHFWVIQVDYVNLISSFLCISKIISYSLLTTIKIVFRKSHLKDFPAYLDLIRMKKVAPLFKNKKFKDILEMDSQDLKNLGVELARDRVKLIKNFWRIKRRIFFEDIIKRIEGQDSNKSNGNSK
ncbi:16273_t:CDS:2, partial [Gigaspora margarita]